ncbi:MAG TPA: hypothetical protein VEJ45_08180 [Candidatus Acidoferrales bacterium]|nr:hypothetical protein [Candidatus Acidoferrales bacterium]
MSPSDTVRPEIDRAQKRAMSLGAIGVIAAVVWGFIDAHRSGGQGWESFFHSYLFAYVFIVSIPLGCLGFLMMHHLTGGPWGLPIRRILEAGTRTLWMTAFLFIPVLVGLSRIFPWTKPGEIPDNAVNHFKRVYLQPGFFITRAVVYFAIWVILAHLLNKWSAEQDQTADPRLKDSMSNLSGPGLVVWSITVGAAAVDWVMSLEPEWYSTIWGMLFMVIMALAGLTFSIVILRTLSGDAPLKDCVRPKDYNDLGNLVLAFTLLWTYMSFSQFLIIWSGNLKDEIPWYMIRARGSWAGVAVVLLLFHFFLPFFVLLQRKVKRRLATLSIVAGWMLVLSLVDVYWLVVPAYEPNAPEFRLLDVLALVGIGGLWLAAFYGQLRRLPLLPLHDPRFGDFLEHPHGD